MLGNRSLPTNTVLPHVRYSDVPHAIAWLTRRFWFQRALSLRRPVSGTQLHLGDAWVMLKTSAPGNAIPRMLAYGTQSLTIFVDSVEEHLARAKAAGAEIVEEPRETVYGELQYGVEDHEGHHRLFSRHTRGLAPEECGATVAPAVIRH